MLWTKAIVSSSCQSRKFKQALVVEEFTLYCRNTRTLGWNKLKPFKIHNPWHHYQIAWQCIFTWWEEFLKISQKCVGWEVEGFSFRLNGRRQYCVWIYEKKCKQMNEKVYTLLQDTRRPLPPFIWERLK